MTTKEIINKLDPADLLSHAPDDEYHTEIEEIDRLLATTLDENEVTKGIYNIFIFAFGEDVFVKDKDECRLIARNLTLNRNIK